MCKSSLVLAPCNTDQRRHGVQVPDHGHAQGDEEDEEVPAEGVAIGAGAHGEEVQARVEAVAAQRLN